MSKNLEELKELVESEKDFNSLRLQDFVLYYLIPVLEDFNEQLENGNNSRSGLEKLNQLINHVKGRR